VRNLLMLAAALVCLPAFAQVPVTPHANQADLLKSSNPTLAANKKLVYDFWRTIIVARQLEQTEKFMLPSYIQHNPNVPTGMKAFNEYFSKLPGGRQAIKPTIDDLVSITAEGDLVTLSFVSKNPDPKDKSKQYTTTSFDMFRIENGKIAEHWDSWLKQ